MATVTRIDRFTRAVVYSALKGPKTPLATLATMLDGLRGNPAWTQHDIEQVQLRAFRRLTRWPTTSRAQLERA